MKNNSEIYIRFLNLATALNISPSTREGLREGTKEVLEEIARRGASGDRPSVSDLMGMRWIGSPATMHRRIGKLRKSGLICIVQDKNDRRIKRVELSDCGLSLIAKLSAIMQQAVASEKGQNHA